MSALTVFIQDKIARIAEWSPRSAIRSRAARFAGCPWCRWLDVHPDFPACTCREDCGEDHCNRRWSVLAIDLKPGTRIERDDTGDNVTVFSVTDPGSDGMLTVTPEQGQPWRVASDWPLRYASEVTP